VNINETAKRAFNTIVEKNRRQLIKAAGRVSHRVLAPHFESQSQRLQNLIAPEAPLALRDFNHLLHELRTIQLRRLPAQNKVLLSAGCAGRWYFDWVEESCGPLREHIGVELYSAQPSELPANASWVVASASSMPQVANSSVDIVFSGQNLEHLSAMDVVNFMLEANRVLPIGGLLALDSPNRLATEALGWCHPEHTIEITSDEATKLITAAGFAIERKVGLWNCRDPRTNEWLKLDTGMGDFAATLDRVAAVNDLDSCFCWWIEARKVGAPDPETIRQIVTTLFSEHWPARVNRAVMQIGGKHKTQPFPIFAGHYRITNTKGVEMTALFDNGDLLGSGRVIEGNLPQTAFGVSVETRSAAGRVEVDMLRTV
jgi:SAM-dependent methyltransferase